MTRTTKLRVLGVMAVAAIVMVAGEPRADWDLELQLFQASNVNRKGRCYGYTMVWEGGRLAPAELTEKVVPAENTAARLDANVFFLYGSELPQRIELRSGAVRPLVSGSPSMTWLTSFNTGSGPLHPKGPIANSGSGTGRGWAATRTS